MSMNMLNQLHNAKLSEISAEEKEKTPVTKLPKHVQRDLARYHEATDLCRLLAGKVRLAGFDPDSGRDEVRRPYDWRSKEISERRRAAVNLKTSTQIALMKTTKTEQRGAVMERYVKALAAI